MTTPIVVGSLFVIARNFSAWRGEARRSLRPLEGFWALSRINIRECVQTRRVGGASRRHSQDEEERKRWRRSREKRTEGG